MNPSEAPVALVTGAAQRIGACLVRTLHTAGYRLILHYRSSSAAAEQLASELNAEREDSCRLLQQDLLAADLSPFAADLVSQWGRLDALINNASSFYPTTLAETTAGQWDDLMGSNLRAPYFLLQALAPALSESRGAVVNIVDVYAERPLPGYGVYSMAKAGLVMLTKSMALELAPEVRVNAVAPGAILWPDEANNGFADEEKTAVAERLPLARKGEPEDIAAAVMYLLKADYVTGQILPVDGGRTLLQ